MQVFEVNKIILSFYSIEVGGVKSEVESYVQNQVNFLIVVFIIGERGAFYKVTGVYMRVPFCTD